MFMFYERYIELCTARNESANAVARQLKIASGTVSEWKKGRVPQRVTLQKLANYFDVSVDYLLGETDQKEKPTPKGEPGEDMVVVHRNGKRIVYHITDNNLDSILPLLETLEAKSDPDL